MAKVSFISLQVSAENCGFADSCMHRCGSLPTALPRVYPLLSGITETDKQCRKVNSFEINILRLRRMYVSAAFSRLRGRRKSRVAGLDPEPSGSDSMPDCCCYWEKQRLFLS